MAKAQSDAARELARARWGSRVAERAAETLIERADELDAPTRRRVLTALDDGAWDATETRENVREW